MSYILEGLKKLEQKRQQEQGAPDLLTFRTESYLKPAKRPLWPYLLLAVLLLNAGAIIWWINPSWRSTERNAPVQPTTNQTASKTHAAAPVENRGQDSIAVTKPEQSKAVSTPPTEITGKETKERLRPVLKETSPSRQSPVVASIPPEPKAHTKTKPPADGHAMKLSELPSEIRNTLPILKMSAHFYSADKPARFARINDNILHEGEALHEGVKVEEINPGGAILSYKGYRFLMGINEK